MSIVNQILRVFLGDKSEKDIKKIMPLVDAIRVIDYTALSNDQLRAKTETFKQNLKEATAGQRTKIEELKQQIENEDDIYRKDSLYKEIDGLSKEAYTEEEKTLIQILPEAFAVIKETAKRFSENTTLSVMATANDRQLSANNGFVSLEEDTAVWNTTWDVLGKAIKWDMTHYDVQKIGGMVLHQGKVAEMATGEGKTLVATFPVYLNALTGRGVHLVTVNDYLAKRDCAWMGPLFQFHGLTVDCIDSHRPSSPERREAYEADIVYGTNNEFGFDYLRDNMAHTMPDLVQRELNYAIIDEVDSVLIDDARTPLIISGPVPQGDHHEYDVLKPKIEHLVKMQQELIKGVFNEAKKLINIGNKKEVGFKLFQTYRGLPKYKPFLKFLNEEGIKQLLQKTEGTFLQDNQREMPKVDADLYFVIEEKNNSIQLTDKGLDFLSQGVETPDFFIMPDLATEIGNIEHENLSTEEQGKKKDKLYREYSIKAERVHTMSQLLKAYTLFEKDVEYVVMEDKVMIVDEQTGRIMDGRRYSDGLHQAIEAKENVKVEAATQTHATITLQNYFRMYNKLAGMTGTAETEAGELWEIYKLDVVTIPTNKPITRQDKHDLIYKTNREKYSAVINQIIKLTQEENRPVLVGTTSVETSELLSKALQMNKIRHNVLNAKMHKKEADIVAEAGQPGIVTIATNMAGRGTDIKISEEVKQRGGLAIIGTERHDSRRVDRQLRGRAGRQGDPGSSLFYVSLEDKLMRLFGSDRIAKIMDRLGHKDGDVIQSGMITNSIEKAQKKVEENNFGVRKRLLEYDDVMNKQREVIYKRRRHALQGERLSIDIVNIIYDTLSSVIGYTKAMGNYKDFEYQLIKYFTINTNVTEEYFKSNSLQALTDKVFEEVMVHYENKEKETARTVLPVVNDVYKQHGDRYERITVPFTDGVKSMNITTSLKTAIETEGKQVFRDFEKNISLALIDEEWKEHLRAMDDLKRASQNAVYEQKDPVLIYKQEGFALFQTMIENLNKEIVSFLFRGELPVTNPTENIQQAEVKKRPSAPMETSRGEMANDRPNTPRHNQEVEITKPRQVITKIGRNETVTVRNVKSGKVEQMKYKQALPLISSGEWIVEGLAE